MRHLYECEAVKFKNETKSAASIEQCVWQCKADLHPVSTRHQQRGFSVDLESNLLPNIFYIFQLSSKGLHIVALVIFISATISRAIKSYLMQHIASPVVSAVLCLRETPHVTCRSQVTLASLVVMIRATPNASHNQNRYILKSYQHACCGLSITAPTITRA